MWGRVKLLIGLLVFSMIVGTGYVGHPARANPEVRPGNVDPYLWKLAKEAPTRSLSVIVLMDRPGRDKLNLMKQFGGKVENEFDFVAGFNGELPASRLVSLSRHPHVSALLYNAPVTLHDIDPTNLRTVYNQVSGTPPLWNSSLNLTGSGITVAVLDTGVNAHPDFGNRLIPVRTNKRAMRESDANGHGTHVAGIIAGRSSDGRYIGVAPEARIIGVKIADDLGKSTEGDLLSGLQWVWNNRLTYNIRVVNLSVSGASPISYRSSPLAAAAEQLWRAGVVVVAASGNRGSDASAVHFAPGNDPHLITVGALDDNMTIDPADDSLAAFSGRGTTQDGYLKPELVAPGRKIVAPLASLNSTLAQQFSDRLEDNRYIRLSGTSMATPVVSGMVALILQKYPNLTPDQVKWALMESARPYANQPDGTANMVDIRAAVDLIARGNVGYANQGIPWNDGLDPATGQVSWSAAYWDAAYWDAAYTESTQYDLVEFD